MALLIETHFRASFHQREFNFLNFRIRHTFSIANSEFAVGRSRNEPHIYILVALSLDLRDSTQMLEFPVFYLIFDVMSTENSRPRYL